MSERNMTIQTTSAASDIFSNSEDFEFGQRVAKVLSTSNLVPTHFRGNVGDCLIALQIARRLGEEPLTVMQNMFLINGKPGWSVQYIIARANKAGVFNGRITWAPAGEGDTLAVTANAVLADTGEPVAVTCDMRMAKAEAWTKNPKYTSMPEHMLRWRSAAMLIRLYAPEVMLGYPIVDEIETQPAAMRDVTPKKTVAQSLDDFAKEADANGRHMGDSAAGETECREGGSAVQGDQQLPPKEAPPPDAPPAAKEVASGAAVPDQVSAHSVSPEGTLAVARARGAADFNRGLQRKAVPVEYRTDEKAAESTAWAEGWNAESERSKQRGK